VSDITKLQAEIAQLQAELMSVSAHAVVAQTTNIFLLDGLIRKGVFSRAYALKLVESVRGTLAASGEHIIDTRSSVRQALDLCLEMKSFLEAHPESDANSPEPGEQP